MSSVKKSSKKLLALILSVLMVLSTVPIVSLSTAFAAEIVNVTVTVFDLANKPIAGANVALGNADSKTDSDGKVTFDVEEADYDLVTSMTGYESQTTPVSISQTTTDITVTLKKTKIIKGNVTGNDDKFALDAVKVTVDPMVDDLYYDEKTGEYSFTGVEGESYTVNAIAKYYIPNSKTVSISSADNNIQLSARLLTATAEIEGNGDITIDGDKSISVRLENEGSTHEANIAAKVNDNAYHIKSVKIKGASDYLYKNNETKNDAKNAVTEKTGMTYTANGSFVIEAVFEINSYDVTVNTNKSDNDISAKVSSESVSHGSKATVTVDTKGDYNIESIVVNKGQEDEKTVEFKEDNKEDIFISDEVEITKNTIFDVKFKEITEITVADAGIKFENHTKVEGNTYYSNKAITLKTDKNRIKVNGKKSSYDNVSLKESTDINSLQVYVKEDGIWTKGNWYDVVDDSNNSVTYKVVIDKDVPTISNLTSPWIKDNSEVWTNSDGTVTFNVADTGDSGIDHVYYSDKNEESLPTDAIEIKGNSGSYSIDFSEAQEKTYYIYAVDKSQNITKKSFDVRIDKTAPMVTDISFDVANDQTIQDETINGKPAKIASDSVTITITAKDEITSSNIKSLEIQLSKYNIVSIGNDQKFDGLITPVEKIDGSDTGYKTTTAKLVVEKSFIENQDPQEIKVIATDYAGNKSNPTDDDMALNNYKNYLLAISTEKPNAKITPSRANGIYSVKEGDNRTVWWYDKDFDITVDVEDFTDEANRKLGTGIKSVDVQINNTSYKDTKDENGVYETGNYSYPATDITHTDSYTYNTNNEVFVEGANTVTVVVTAYNGIAIEKDYKFYLDRFDPYVSNVKVEPAENNGWLKRLLFGNFSNSEVEITVNTIDDYSSSGIKQIILFNGSEELDRQTPDADNKAVFKIKVPKANSDNGTDAFIGNLTVKVIDNVDRSNGDTGVSIVNETVNNVNQTNKKVSSNAYSNYFDLEQSAPTISTSIQKTPDVNENTFDSTKIWYGKDQIINVQFYDIANKEEKEAGLNNIKATVNGVLAFEEDLTKDENGANKTVATHHENRTIDTAKFDIGDANDYKITLYAQDNAGNDITTNPEIYVDKSPAYIKNFEFDTKNYQDGKEDGFKTSSTENGEINNAGVVATDYGYYFNKATKVTITASDEPTDNKPSSGVKTITYILLNYDGSVKKTETILVDKNNQITIDIPADFKGQIVARATDNVNHTGDYVNPDGVIYEKNAPSVEFDALVDVNGKYSTIRDVNGVNELFNNNVVVGFTANDSAVLDSGIRTIKWKIEAPYDKDNNKSGSLTIDNAGKIESTEGEVFHDFQLLDVTDHNLVHSVWGAICVKNDSNDIKVTITVTDRSGNSASETKVLSIDKTAPVIDITFEDGDKKTGAKDNQYNTARTAVITIKERNFDPKLISSTIKNIDSDYTSVPSLKKLAKIKNWNPNKVGYNTEDPDGTTYTIKVNFPKADGTYEFVASLNDMVGNASNVAKPTVFIIDGTAPSYSISYDSKAEVQNGNYYNDTVVATITIVEHNFDEKLLTNKITGKNNGDNKTVSFKQPRVVWQKNAKGKDTHVATVTFTDNFEYSVLFDLVDESGNKYKISKDKFSVDKNAPEFNIKGIKKVSNAAYNDDNITPVLTITDADGNIDPSKIIVKLIGTKSNHEEKQYNTIADNVKTTKNGYVFTLRDFQNIDLDTDDIYYLAVEAFDLAGNRYKYDCHFSVNRFGSTYKSDFTVDKENDIAYTTSVLDKKLFSEVNCDFLDPSKTVLTLTYTNEEQIESTTKTLERGKDYTISEPRKKADEFNIKTYDYTLTASLFALDGMYEIFATTVDDAGNKNQNNKAVRKEAATKKVLSFVVDNNAPVIDYQTSLENTKATVDDDDSGQVTTTITKGKIRDENFSTDGKTATLTLDLSEKNLPVDVIDAKSLKVTYNGEKVEAPISDDGKTATFVLNADEGLASGHELAVTLLDKAGNRSELKYEKLLVSNNWFVRFINNKPAFFGTIAGILAAICGLMIFIIIKKRRKDEDEE